LQRALKSALLRAARQPRSGVPGICPKSEGLQGSFDTCSVAAPEPLPPPHSFWCGPNLPPFPIVKTFTFCHPDRKKGPKNGSNVILWDRQTYVVLEHLQVRSAHRYAQNTLPYFYISERSEQGISVWGRVWSFCPPGFAGFVVGRKEMSAHGREAPRPQRGEASKGKGAEARGPSAPGKAARGSFCQNAPSLPAAAAPSWYGIAHSPNSLIKAFPLEMEMQQAACFFSRKLWECPLINLRKT